MYCTNCGSKNNKSNKFCEKCGNKLDTIEKQNEIINRANKVTKEDIKNGPSSMKLAYYSQFLIPISIVISAIFIFLHLRIAGATAPDDSLGWALIIFGPILLIFHIYYFTIILVISLIKIDKWLHQKENISKKSNNSRVIAMIVFYVLCLLPALNRIPFIITGIIKLLNK